MTSSVFPLGELVDVVSGGTPSRSQPSFFGGGIPWVKIGDMLQGTIRHTEETISESGLKGSSAKMLPSGTLLLSIFATIGRTAILGVDAATNQAIAGLRILEPSRVDRDYLRRYLEFSSESLVDRGRGVAQANINLSILRSHLVPLPPIEEQRRIASILDAADALRTKRRQAIEKIDSLTQAIFVDMFGTVLPTSSSAGVPLGDVLTLQRGFDLPVSDRRPGKVPVLAANGPVGFHDVEKVKGPGVITGRSGTIGSVRHVRSDYWPLNTALYVKDFKGNDPIYVCWLLRNFQLKRFSRGVGVPTLNRNLVHEAPVILAPVEDQLVFASAVLAVDRVRDHLSSQLDGLDNLFAGLQHRAFRGEL